MDERACRGNLGILGALLEYIRSFSVQDILKSLLDVAILAYLFYRIFILIRGTRAVQLLEGIALLFAFISVTKWMGLYAVNWLLERVSAGLFVALPVVFHQEIRRALEYLGRGGSLVTRSLFSGSLYTSEKVIDEIVEAVGHMSASRTGALMVVERTSGLEEFMEEAVALDSVVTSELLENIFFKNTPLHDGAVIIRGNRVAAAACFLPSTQEAVTIELGSRHRAALGVTQVSDAVAVAVSEETGTVSLAVGGRLLRGLDLKTLKEKLVELLPEQQPIPQLFHRGSAK
jgi:diadenylate cyclase